MSLHRNVIRFFNYLRFKGCSSLRIEATNDKIALRRFVSVAPAVGVSFIT